MLAVMTKLADQLLTKALTLNVKERARLASAIQASVKTDDELTPAYRTVLKKRVRELNDGTAEILSARTVGRLMRERLGKKK